MCQPAEKYCITMDVAVANACFQMDQSNSADGSLEDCLRGLQILSLIDWDVLIFVYRHGFNLSNADQMGRLLGYTSKEVGAALERLECQSLIQRSRYSAGARFYSFARSEPVAPESCLGRLMSLAETREGRLVLIKLLRQDVGRQTAATGRSE
jgi:hypothetical protein